MPVTSLLSSDAQELTIFIEGSFDFKAHHDFRNAYESLGPEQRYIVDLGAVSFLDSSALGMLLLLRDHAGGEHARIRLINCSSDVRKILTISNFSKLFHIG